MRSFLIFGMISLILAACGGGGGGTSTASTGLLGSASDQGTTVQVTQTGGGAGQISARIAVSTDAGEPAPATVSAWVGGEYDPPAAPATATAVPGLAGSYDVTLASPASLPSGAAVWVRVDRADGSRIEMGRSVFPLP